MRKGFVDRHCGTPRPEQVVSFLFEFIENAFERGESRTGRKYGLTHIPLLVEDLLTTTDKGLVVDSVKGLEQLRLHPLQEWREKRRVKGVIVLIEQIGLPFLATVKGELSAIFPTKAAAHHELVVRVKETVAGSCRDTEEKRFESPEAAAFPRLVRPINNVQPGTLR